MMDNLRIEESKESKKEETKCRPCCTYETSTQTEFVRIFTLIAFFAEVYLTWLESNYHATNGNNPEAQMWGLLYSVMSFLGMITFMASSICAMIEYFFFMRRQCRYTSYIYVPYELSVARQFIGGYVTAYSSLQLVTLLVEITNPTLLMFPTGYKEAMAAIVVITIILSIAVNSNNAGLKLSES